MGLERGRMASDISPGPNPTTPIHPAANTYVIQIYPPHQHPVCYMALQVCYIPWPLLEHTFKLFLRGGRKNIKNLRKNLIFYYMAAGRAW